MITTAIIAEYNPFHNGHLYQIQQARKITQCDFLIIIMSGHFVQRGEIACIDARTRCKMALNAGADLILELPLYGATGSAEIFAESAVSILNQLHFVDYLCFGTETEHLSLLSDIATLLLNEPPVFKDHLKTALLSGYNFPAARSLALQQYFSSSKINSIITQPNNILAIEYLKALQKYHSRIKPIAIKRIGENYHSEISGQQYSSATALRKQMYLSSEISSLSPSIPEAVYKLITEYCQHYSILSNDDMSAMIAYRLLDPSVHLADYVDVNTDIANRIHHMLPYFENFSQFTQLLATKNLTQTRIQRSLIHILLGCRKEQLTKWKTSDYHDYIPVIGFNRSAACLFKQLPDEIKRSLVINPPKDYEKLTPLGKELFNTNLFAVRIYKQIQRLHHHQVTDPLSEPVIII